MTGSELRARRPDALRTFNHRPPGHPSGEWSQGWDEIRATWEVFAGFGRHDRGGSQIRGLRAHVYGDVAYTTCLFIASSGFGGETLA